MHLPWGGHWTCKLGIRTGTATLPISQRQCFWNSCLYDILFVKKKKWQSCESIIPGLCFQQPSTCKNRGITFQWKSDNLIKLDCVSVVLIFSLYACYSLPRCVIVNIQMPLKVITWVFLYLYSCYALFTLYWIITKKEQYRMVNRLSKRFFFV